MIRKVMLDLDDVCNTFTMSALKYVGATTMTLGYSEYPDCGWDIVAAANKLQDPKMPKFTSKSFWDALGRKFWSEIPTTTYYLDLIEFLRHQVGDNNVCIATSATWSPECLAGKLEWIHKYMPKFLHRQYMMGTQKHLLADSDALLIDDKRGNCEKFRLCGGSAIMVSRPWNSDYQIGKDYRSLQAGLAVYFGETL